MYNLNNINHMLCKDLMKSEIVKAYKHSSILECAKLMKTHNIGFLPIVYKDTDFIIGVITDRDLVVRGIAKEKSINEPIFTICTSDFVSCFEDDDVSFAISKMADHQIKRILVTNKQKQLSGIISLKDIATCDKTNGYLNDLLKETCDQQSYY